MTWTERRQEGQKKENTFGKLTCQVCIILHSLYLPQSYVCTYLTLEDSDDLYYLSKYPFQVCIVLQPTHTHFTIYHVI